MENYSSFFNYLYRLQMFSAVGTDRYYRAISIVLQHSGDIRWFGCTHQAVQRYAILMTTSPLMSFVDLMIM